MPATMPTALKEAMFEDITRRLDSYMEGRVYPPEIATTFNFILYDEFSSKRELDGEQHSLHPVFVGEYFVDPSNPEQTRVYSHHGTEACSPIPIERGVIGRAVRTGEDQYVPDVTQDPLHVGCDPTMEGSELVLISWSEPYHHSSSYGGKRVPLGVLDLDFHMKDALTRDDVLQLRRIWDTYGKLIFPGVAPFQPQGELAVQEF